MKSLLIFPILILLSSCIFGPSDEEEHAAHVKEVLDTSIEAFEFNAILIEAELKYGELCKNDILETGDIETDDCKRYVIARELAVTATSTGIILLAELFEEGYLSLDSPRFPEIETAVEHLIKLTEDAHKLDIDIKDFIGPDCVKCAI